MERRDILIGALGKCQRLAASIAQRWSAYMALHQAAVINGNQEEMAQRRGELHAVLDSLLDNGEAIQKYMDELGVVNQGFNPED